MLGHLITIYTIIKIQSRIKLGFCGDSAIKISYIIKLTKTIHKIERQSDIFTLSQSYLSSFQWPMHTKYTQFSNVIPNIYNRSYHQHRITHIHKYQ